MFPRYIRARCPLQIVRSMSAANFNRSLRKFTWKLAYFRQSHLPIARLNKLYSYIDEPIDARALYSNFSHSIISVTDVDYTCCDLVLLNAADV